MRYLPPALAIAAFVATLAAGVFTWQTLIAPGTALRLLVDVPAGAALAPGLVAQVRLPMAGLPPSAVTDPAVLRGSYAAADLFQGQLLSAQHLAATPPSPALALVQRILGAGWRSPSSGSGALAMPGVPVVWGPAVRLADGGDAPALEPAGLAAGDSRPSDGPRHDGGPGGAGDAGGPGTPAAGEGTGASSPDGRGALSQALAADRRVLSFPVIPERVLAGALQPGDRVDLIAVVPGEDSKPDPQLLLAGIPVVDVRNAAALSTQKPAVQNPAGTPASPGSTAVGASGSAGPAGSAGSKGSADSAGPLGAISAISSISALGKIGTFSNAGTAGAAPDAVPAAVLLSLAPDEALTAIAAVESGAAIYLLLAPAAEGGEGP